MYAQIIAGEARQQDERNEDERQPSCLFIFPFVHSHTARQRAGGRGVAAGKRIAGGRGDRVARRQDTAVPDPGTIDARRQLDQRRQQHAKIVGHQSIKPLPLVPVPVIEYRDQDQIGGSEHGDKLHEGRPGVLNAVPKILKREQVLNIHGISLPLFEIIFSGWSAVLGRNRPKDALRTFVF